MRNLPAGTRIRAAPPPFVHPCEALSESLLADEIASRSEQRLPAANSSVVLVTLIVAPAAPDGSVSAPATSSPSRLVRNIRRMDRVAMKEFNSDLPPVRESA